jgi:ABC-2 type transport system permease protein
MNTTAIWSLIRNDLRIYLSDRRALVVGILVPILIAAFFGYVFGGVGKKDSGGKIPIAVVDEDQSTVSRAIVQDLQKDSMVAVQLLDRTSAEKRVLEGKLDAAAILPKEFGRQTTRALFSGLSKPVIEVLLDPSKATSAQVVQGLLAQYAMQQISKESFSGPGGTEAMDEFLGTMGEPTPGESADQTELRKLLQSARSWNSRNAGSATPGSGNESGGAGLSIPYSVQTRAMTANKIPYNGYAHSFAGMSVQFILFAGIDAGILLLLLRSRGIWQRIRTAPLTKTQFLLARALSTMLISLFMLTIIYLAAILIFGVRIDGSLPGFVAIAIAFCLLNACFGLMLATLGRSAPTARGLATMSVLLLVMLGGAWVPAFVFPQWLQDLSRVSPARWAVDGFDGMTWRGLPFEAAVMPTAVLVGTAVACLAIAIWRFRWEE